MDNVVESVESSRKTVLIVTNTFASSQWCYFELVMAQSRLFREDRDNLILVMMEKINDDLITPRLRYQMERQTYIEWTGSQVGQKLFWKQLLRAIKRARTEY